MNKKNKCSLAEGFSLWEKIYAQFSFITMGVIGTVGIALADLAVGFTIYRNNMVWSSGSYNEAFNMSKVSTSL